jgi:hypothetical protein
MRSSGHSARAAGGSHAIDIRITFPLLIKSYYLVLLVGPERRSQPRGILPLAGRLLSRLLAYLGIAIIVIGIVGLALYCTYLLKWMVGIDLLPDGGLHITPPQLWRAIMGE